MKKIKFSFQSFDDDYEIEGIIDSIENADGEVGYVRSNN